MKRRSLSLLALLSAAALTAVGIALGQPGEVWAKAVRVCLECVGIG